MLLILIFVLILFACVITTMFFKNTSFKLYSIVIGFDMIFITSCLLFLACNVQFNESENYEKMLHQKTVIEQRIENTGNVETLYEKIEEFNNKIEEHKKYCDNLWVNLFYSKKIATIDYIQIKTFTQEVK